MGGVYRRGTWTTSDDVLRSNSGPCPSGQDQASTGVVDTMNQGRSRRRRKLEVVIPISRARSSVRAIPDEQATRTRESAKSVARMVAAHAHAIQPTLRARFKSINSTYDSDDDDQCSIAMSDLTITDNGKGIEQRVGYMDDVGEEDSDTSIRSHISCSVDESDVENELQQKRLRSSAPSPPACSGHMQRRLGQSPTIPQPSSIVAPRLHPTRPSYPPTPPSQLSSPLRSSRSVKQHQPSSSTTLDQSSSAKQKHRRRPRLRLEVSLPCPSTRKGTTTAQPEHPHSGRTSETTRLPLDDTDPSYAQSGSSTLPTLSNVRAVATIPMNKGVGQASRLPEGGWNDGWPGRWGNNNSITATPSLTNPAAGFQMEFAQTSQVSEMDVDNSVGLGEGEGERGGKQSPIDDGVSQLGSQHPPKSTLPLLQLSTQAAPPNINALHRDGSTEVAISLSTTFSTDNDGPPTLSSTPSSSLLLAPDSLGATGASVLACSSQSSVPNRPSSPAIQRERAITPPAPTSTLPYVTLPHNNGQGQLDVSSNNQVNTRVRTEPPVKRKRSPSQAEFETDAANGDIEDENSHAQRSSARAKRSIRPGPIVEEQIPGRRLLDGAGSDSCRPELRLVDKWDENTGESAVQDVKPKGVKEEDVKVGIPGEAIKCNGKDMGSGCGCLSLSDGGVASLGPQGKKAPPRTNEEAPEAVVDSDAHIPPGRPTGNPIVGLRTVAAVTRSVCDNPPGITRPESVPGQASSPSIVTASQAAAPSRQEAARLQPGVKRIDTFLAGFSYSRGRWRLLEPIQPENRVVDLPDTELELSYPPRAVVGHFPTPEEIENIYIHLQLAPLVPNRLPLNDGSFLHGDHLWDRVFHPNMRRILGDQDVRYPILNNPAYPPEADVIQFQFDKWRALVMTASYKACILGGSESDNQAMKSLLERKFGGSLSFEYLNPLIQVLASKLDAVGRIGLIEVSPCRILSSNSLGGGQFGAIVTTEVFAQFLRHCSITASTTVMAGWFKCHGKVSIYSYAFADRSLRLYTTGQGVGPLFEDHVQILLDSFTEVLNLPEYDIDVELLHLAPLATLQEEGPLAIIILELLMSGKVPHHHLLDAHMTEDRLMAWVPKVRLQQAQYLLDDHAAFKVLDQRLRALRRMMDDYVH